MSYTLSTVLTNSGQATIPKVLRDYLGYKAGEPVIFEMKDDGSVVLTNRQKSFLSAVETLDQARTSTEKNSQNHPDTHKKAPNLDFEEVTEGAK